MVKQRALKYWHSVQGDVYHHHEGCEAGSRIATENLRPGRGSRKGCFSCMVQEVAELIEQQAFDSDQLRRKLLS